ncbi:fused MFS/spermidine synthase [Niveibacterium sp. SC-1]|uniref:fused MFS/spermidine synthase n=1 Tax=Niveibacterium sp. SC-1 TaxID=3135646 RepID=UPI00311DB1ED
MAHPDAGATRPSRRLLAKVPPSLLICTSGVAALIYQVLWIKQISLLVGVDVYAVSLTLSGFFAGLACGAAWLGRKADGLARPARAYALIESGIAVGGLGLTVILPMLAMPFARIEDAIGPAAWSLPFLAIALPAFLMGGTVPVLMRACADARGVAHQGGRFYAANTLGAIVGTLIASFLLIPALGVRGTACVAAGLNILAAIGAFGLRMRTEHLAAARHAPAPETALTEPGARRALTLYAIAGGLALGYEVIWSQALVQFMSTRAYAFSVMLAVFLTGLAVGSGLYARRADRTHDAWGVFGVLIALAGLLALLGVAWLGDWLAVFQTAAEVEVRTATGSVLAGMSARFFLAALVVVFLPALALGAAFPAAVRLCVQTGAIGRGMGRVLAWNTLGGIAGSLLCGLVLLPLLGLVRSLSLLAGLAVVLGLVAAYGQPAVRAKRIAIALMAPVVAVLAVITPRDHLAQLLVDARGGELVFYEESRGGTVAVLGQNKGQNALRRLYIQGVSNSGDAMTSQRYMRLQALLPLIIHPGEPRSAMVIGLGTGITAGALLAYPSLEKRVVAELLPAVKAAAAGFHGNYQVTRDPRMDIRLRDGRRTLLASDEHYDLITLEPPPPSASGVVNLYSRDFYRLAASRLNPQGIVAQWLPLPTQNDEDSRALVKSFVEAFPHASLWTTELHETLMIGSLTPITLDAERIAQRFERGEVSVALGEVGIDTPAALLANWITDRDGLARYAGDAAPVTDDDPRIEYAGWLRDGEFARVLPKIFALQSPLPLTHSTPKLDAEIARRRDLLLSFYEAGLYAYQGDHETARRALAYVMEREPDNAYFRWMVGQ